jgi:cobaltochelatase CobN
VLDFIRVNNPDALKEMADRFDEAIRRDLWQPRLNSTKDVLRALAAAEPERNQA